MSEKYFPPGLGSQAEGSLGRLTGAGVTGMFPPGVRRTAVRRTAYVMEVMTCSIPRCFVLFRHEVN